MGLGLWWNNTRNVIHFDYLVGFLELSDIRIYEIMT